MGANGAQQTEASDDSGVPTAHAGRAAVLVDGATYFGALRSSLLQAKRSVIIVGWDVDSRCPVRGEDAPDDGAPETLGPLLSDLTKRNPDIQIYVLLWDYSVLYALEREPLPRLSLDWLTPARVHVCLDNALPFGAAHHEKLVVIDAAVAFCGGLDLAIRRWDRSAHLPRDPQRKDPDGETYGAFHDVQMLVDGDAAMALADLARSRWEAAGGRPAMRVSPAGDPWPEHVTADFQDVEIGIARTRAEYDGSAVVEQVEAAYLQAIRAADSLIYIENQYLTVPSIASALRTRLLDCSRLELIIVTPRLPGGWLEEQTMGAGRQRFVDRLPTAEAADRIRVVYPWVKDAAGDPQSVMVHAKLMIVDDQHLHLGSSNLACRSMGLDTECDLLVDARETVHKDAIQKLRRRLMAEHLGVSVDQLAEQEAASESVIKAMHELQSERRGVSDLETVDAIEEPWTDLAITLADPEAPIAAEDFAGDLFGAMQIRPAMRRGAKALLLAGALLAAWLIWRLSPLSEWTNPERMWPLMETLRASPWAGPAVLGLFLVGSLVAFPVTALVAATAIALGPWSGFGWALAGCLLGATATYGVGRLVGGKRLERLLGGWVSDAADRLRGGGIIPIMVLRNVPIAPFTFVNVVAGATVGFRDFLIGTALGMAPGVAAVTLLGDRLGSALENPDAASLALLALAVVVWIGVARGLQVLSNRFLER